MLQQRHYCEKHRRTHCDICETEWLNIGIQQDLDKIAKLEAEVNRLRSVLVHIECEPINAEFMAREALGKPMTETKEYSDGITATGTTPLPNFSPRQQDTRERNDGDVKDWRCVFSAIGDA